MLAVSLFWVATAVLLICALFFIVPPLWLTSATAQLSSRMQIMYSGCLILSLVLASYFLYSRLGSAAQLPAYYDPANVAQRQNFVLLRPLYTRIQRELVKDQLDLKLDLENVDLILNFAQIHSQAQQGVLQPEIQQLLLAVLKTVPEQVTALNLLAIHAYKTSQYAQAIAYWQSILHQFTAEMRNTPLEKILLDKIDQTRAKLQAETSQALRKNTKEKYEKS